MSNLEIGATVWCIGQDAEREMYGHNWPVEPFEAKLIDLRGFSAKLEIVTPGDPDGWWEESSVENYYSYHDLFESQQAAMENWRERAQNYGEWLADRSSRWLRAAETGIPINGITDSF